METKLLQLSRFSTVRPSSVSPLIYRSLSLSLSPFHSSLVVTVLFVCVLACTLLALMGSPEVADARSSGILVRSQRERADWEEQQAEAEYDPLTLRQMPN